MNWRIIFLYMLPVTLALAAYLITGEIIPTTLALLAGFGILYLIRGRLLPPHVDKAAQLYRTGRLEEALEQANLAVRTRPERWEGYYVRSLINFSLDRPREAEADARQAIQNDRSAASGHAMLGQVLYWQNHLDEALLSFEEAVQLDGRDAMNHFWMGTTLHHLEQDERAIPHLELVRKLKIPNKQLELLATYYLGLALQGQGDEEAAQAQFARLKEYDDALRRLKSDLEQAPETPALPRLRREVAAIEARTGRQG